MVTETESTTQEYKEKRPLVSIVCMTYNHKQYIRDALDGFLMQRTQFPFEIIVHDDASTDGTAEIIKEYQKKYSDIINPILQNDNKYSQGVSIQYSFIYPKIKGEFTALCEGDDYWTDPYKLQKQYDFMREHPNIDICAHKAADTREGKVVRYIGPDYKDCIIPVEEVILGGGGFVATNSLMIRTKTIKKKPKFREILGLDYSLQIQGSLGGGMGYLDDCMSVYRRGVTGSWTSRMRSDIDNLIKHHERVEEMLLSLDDYTGKEYEKTIKKAINKNRFDMYVFTEDYKTILKSDYREFLKDRPIKSRIKIILKGLLDG